MKTQKQLSLFAGGFGSGKTEVALNYAVNLHQKGFPVTVVDLDILNHYFRAGTAKKSLEKMGIAMISPREELAYADLPALSPGIYSVLQGGKGYGVLDIGGDDLGAIALSRFREDIPEDGHCFFLVVNPYRPMTADVKGIDKVKRSIESASRLKIHALVSNPNLGHGTDIETVMNGHQIVMKASEELGLPVDFLSIRRDLADLIAVELPLLPMDLFIKPPW
ncbi:MAG: hypothetical protein XD78_2172 [Desulfotomaculum sp. 46_296]|nr:MAG: hypothetical protein XD78_2172 [Desulfotomaculum sp. 46_296]